jgi:hypothetical protein
MKELLVILLMAISNFSISNSSEIEYLNNEMESYYQNKPLPSKIESLSFTSCTNEFIKMEIIKRYVNNNIEMLNLFRIDTIDIDFLTANCNNLRGINIQTPQFIKSDSKQFDLINYLIIFCHTDKFGLKEHISLIRKFKNLKILEITGINFGNNSDSDSLISLVIENSQIERLKLGVFTNINIDDRFMKLQHLRELNLFGSDSLTLPKNIDALVNIQSLTITGFNKVNTDTLFQGISNLKYLEHLSLSLRSLRYFPKVFYNLSELKSLEIHESNLKEISSDICRLKKLKRLSIDYSSIDDLPDDLIKMTELNYINLGLTFISDERLNYFKKNMIWCDFRTDIKFIY